MSSIRCICLDFDGTIMTYDEPPGFFHPGAVELLNRLAARGVMWCTNSGRDFGDQVQILNATRARGLTHLPRAVLSSECFVFMRQDGVYLPHEPWNTDARECLRRFHTRIQQRLRPQLADLTGRYAIQDIRLQEDATVFLMKEEGGGTALLRGEIVKLLFPEAGGGLVTQNGPWLAVLPVQLGKGEVLRAFMRAEGLGPENVLAIGDHLNDLSMLDGSVAHHVGCPGDAVAEVAAAVRRAGGRVAEAAGPLGTVEVMQGCLGEGPGSGIQPL